MEVRWGVADLVHKRTTMGILANSVGVDVVCGCGPLGRPPLLDDVRASQGRLHVHLGAPG